MRRSRITDFAIPMSAILWALLLLVPWVPKGFEQKPNDAAYTLFSHIAFAQGAPWGTHTLHTSGPLGFLRFPQYYAPTYELLLLGNAVLAAAAALLLYHLLQRGLARWALLSVIAGATWVLSQGDDGVWLFLLLVSQLLIPEVERAARWSLRPPERWVTWPLLLNLGFCALAANVKGSFLLMSSVLVIELGLLELRGRRAPVFSLGFSICVVVLARLAGLQLADWGPYTTHILGSLSGYAESFAQPGSPKQAVVLIALVVVFLALAAVDHARRFADRFEAVVRWAGLALLVWITAKGALVRQDWIHELRTVSALLVFLAVYVLGRSPAPRVAMRAAYAFPALALTSLFVLTLSAIPTGGRLFVDVALKRFALFVRSGPTAAAAQDARNRDEIAAKMRSAQSQTGSVAVFGSYQSLLLADLDRRVELPFVASYEIWSPWASRRERDFLMSADAPDILLYSESPTSGELALTITARYATVERRKGYQVLRRRETPLRVRKRVVFDASVDADRRIEIPAVWRQGPAVAEVYYEKTLTNRLISTLYQPPEAFLVLFNGSVPTAKVRMNSLLSPEGIVLSGAPGVWDGEPDAILGTRFGALTDERVDATEFGFAARGAVGNDWSRYFQPRLHVRVYIPEFG